MARKSKAVRERQVKTFLFLSATVLFLGLSLLLFFTSVDLFSFGKRGKRSASMKRVAVPSTGVVVQDVANHFRRQSGIAGVFYDLKSVPAEIFIRLQTDVSSRLFISGLKRFLLNRNADLVSSQYDRISEYPVRIVVDVGTKPLIIRAGWVEKKGTSIRPKTFRPGKVRKPSGSRIAPRIAIVLDDAGDRNPYQWLFLNLKAKVTFAVMPHLEDSACFSRRARKRGFEIILHAPMEPLNTGKMRMPAAMFRVGMDRTQVGTMLYGFLRSVPGAVGLNNHMGSRVTGDAATMSRLMSVLQGKKLFFLDSRTHSSSVAFRTARKAGIPALRRDVFLDHQRSYSYIQDRLVELAGIAAKNGYAIGIGHVTHRNMYLALRRMIPKLKKTGFRFVHLSELFR